MLADAGQHVLQRPALGDVVEHVAGRDQRRAAARGEPGQRLDAGGIVAAIAVLRREIAAWQAVAQLLQESRESSRRARPAAGRPRSGPRRAPAGPRARAGTRPSRPAAGRARSAATAGHRRRGRSGSRAASGRGCQPLPSSDPFLLSSSGLTRGPSLPAHEPARHEGWAARVEPEGDKADDRAARPSWHRGRAGRRPRSGGRPPWRRSARAPRRPACCGRSARAPRARARAARSTSSSGCEPPRRNEKLLVTWSSA